MNDIREIHSAPLSGPHNEQNGHPRVASRVKAGAALTGRWIVEEAEGWHRRRLAIRELNRHLGRAAR